MTCDIRDVKMQLHYTIKEIEELESRKERLEEEIEDPEDAAFEAHKYGD